jgi:hypothetical protein
LPAESREFAVSALVEGFAAEPPRVQLGIAYALANQSVPWSSSDTNHHSELLYRIFIKAEDNVLKSAIDDALSNARGSYRDGAIDYSKMDFSDVAGSVSKFRTVIEKFPKSRYLPNAVFYMSQYLTRAYIAGGRRDRALLELAIANLSRAVSITDKPKSDLWPDASYYLAMDYLLRGDQEAAVGTLDDMTRQFSDQQQVYVYQFFYSEDQNTVIDRSFSAPFLAWTTKNYVERSGIPSPDAQKPFIEHVFGADFEKFQNQN